MQIRRDSHRKEKDGADAHMTQQKQKLNVEKPVNKGITEHTPNVNNKLAKVNVDIVGAALKTLQDPEGRATHYLKRGKSECVPNSIKIDVKADASNSTNASPTNVHISSKVFLHGDDDNVENTEADQLLGIRKEMLLGNLSQHVIRMTSTADTYMNAREMTTCSKSLRESMPSPGECTKEQLSHCKFLTTLPSTTYRSWEKAQTYSKFKSSDLLKSFVNTFPLCFQWDEFAPKTDRHNGWYCPCSAFMGGISKTQPKALTPGWLLHFKEVSEHVDLLGNREGTTLYKDLNCLGIHCMILKEH